MIHPLRKIRYVKWWFQRANHEVPPCDYWDFKYSLADYIRQGLEGLLHEGVTDWDAPCHRREKKDLEFILDWAIEFPYYESAIVAFNQDDWVAMKKKFQNTDATVLTREQFDEFEKRTEKAMRLLAKNIHTLWS